MPGDQVELLRESQSTPIENVLRSLAENTDIRSGSPILISISYHSDVVRPQRMGGDETGMLYSTFFELVSLVSQKQGENVVTGISFPVKVPDPSQVVILNTNFPGLDRTAAGIFVFFF